MDWYDGKPYMIRRSRGYAPLPFFYGNSQGKDVLAIGGELKNCFCIGRNNLFYPSPYIGDMSDIRTVQALRESVQRMASLLEASPSVVACDLHPATTRRPWPANWAGLSCPSSITMSTSCPAWPKTTVTARHRRFL